MGKKEMESSPSIRTSLEEDEIRMASLIPVLLPPPLKRLVMAYVDVYHDQSIKERIAKFIAMLTLKGEHQDLVDPQHIPDRRVLATFKAVDERACAPSELWGDYHIVIREPVEEMDGKWSRGNLFMWYDDTFMFVGNVFENLDWGVVFHGPCVLEADRCPRCAVLPVLWRSRKWKDGATTVCR